MEQMALRRLVRMIGACIESAQAPETTHPRVERALQHVLAMLWSAHDELETLADVPLAPPALTPITAQR
jgi:hypothetical protein